jgi:hypothetical protein
MIVIRNRWLPIRGYDAMNLFGCLLCRRETVLSDDLVLHERIHTRQMMELLFVGFYLWYLVEWLIRLPLRGNAYRNISFEREAYAHQLEPDYLSRRKRYAWWHYLWHPIS